jgi:hypothetical protein
MSQFVGQVGFVVRGILPCLFGLGLVVGGCSSGEPAAEGDGLQCRCEPVNGMPPEQTDWAERARIANADLDWEMSTEEVIAVLRQRVDERVSVIEVDSGLSDYRSDADFAVQASFLKCVACLAHNEGLRTAAYYPSLEVITTNGRNAASSMFKDHPDWVQQGIDGSPNVFYGSAEFWVEADDESAWMSPNGPWRAIYLQRIKALAAAGLDAIWVDVPLFMDTGTPWPGVEPGSSAEFARWSGQRGRGGGGRIPVSEGRRFSGPGVSHLAALASREPSGLPEGHLRHGCGRRATDSHRGRDVPDGLHGCHRQGVGWPVPPGGRQVFAHLGGG